MAVSLVSGARGRIPRPNMVMPRSVAPAKPPKIDYGQRALYPGGYQGTYAPPPPGSAISGGTGIPPGGITAGRSPAQQALMNPYRNMIGGDWDVQGAESAMNAGMGVARGNFTSQLRQALIDLGVTDTSKLGSFGSYIDADTISKAAQNKYSQTAQIGQQEVARRAQSEADLAARGMLSSGQLTTDTENTLAQGESARYSALRDFLGAGQQGLSNLADMNNQYAQQLQQARFAAAARAADLYNSAEMWDWENQQGRYGVPPPAATMNPNINPATGRPWNEGWGPRGPISQIPGMIGV